MFIIAKKKFDAVRFIRQQRRAQRRVLRFYRRKYAPLAKMLNAQ